MGNAGGFITLHRKLIDWEWYKDGITKDVFIHLLLKANFVDTKYRGIEIKRGQVMTSLTGISTDLGITIQQARTAIDHLKSTGEITDHATNQYRVITVVKYDDYQNSTGQATGNQQATNRPSNKQSTGQAQTDQQHNNNINNTNNVNKETMEQTYTGDFDFDVFWNEYPKKVGKQDAMKSWKKIKPDEHLMEKIISGLRNWKASDQWLKENGQYIPFPATWLNKRRWEDEVPVKRKEPASPVQPKAPEKKVVAQNYEQRNYGDFQREIEDQQAARIIARLRAEGRTDV